MLETALVSSMSLQAQRWMPLGNPIVHHSSQGHFALRYGNWKFIEKRGSGGFTPPAFMAAPPDASEARIFNLKNDPSEKNDLAKEYPNQLEIMKLKLDSIRQPN